MCWLLTFAWFLPTFILITYIWHRDIVLQVRAMPQTSLAPTMSAVSCPPTINTFPPVTAPHPAWPSAFPTSESQVDVVRDQPSFVQITPTLPDVHPAFPSQEGQLAEKPIDQDR